MSDLTDQINVPCLSPQLCLLGDRTQVPQISNGEFSLAIAGIITAARIILRHWETPELLDLKGWANLMPNTASHEHEIDGRNKK